MLDSDKDQRRNRIITSINFEPSLTTETPSGFSLFVQHPRSLSQRSHKYKTPIYS